MLEGKAMRKEEEPEQAGDLNSEGKPKSRPSRKPLVEAEQDENMGDEALLGESTLAKLNVGRQVEDTPPVAEKVAEEKEPRRLKSGCKGGRRCSRG